MLISVNLLKTTVLSCTLLMGKVCELYLKVVNKGGGEVGKREGKKSPSQENQCCQGVGGGGGMEVNTNEEQG